jgi:hypothetical protein
MRPLIPAWLRRSAQWGLACVLATTAAQPTAAQTAPIRAAALPQVLVRETRSQLQTDTALRTPSSRMQVPSTFRLNASAPDHRWTGLVVGAVAGAVAFGIIGHSTCDDGGACLGPTLGIGLLGAVGGGVLGGLVGSLIPRHEH